MANTPSFVNEFNKGLQQNIAPNIAHSGAAVICTNVDLSRGSIASINGPRKLQDLEGPVVVEFKKKLSGHDAYSPAVKMLNQAFIATKDGILKTKDGEYWDSISIEPPKTAISVTPGLLNQKPIRSVQLSQYDGHRLRWKNDTGQEVTLRLYLPPLTNDNVKTSVKDMWKKRAYNQNSPELPYRTTTLKAHVFVELTPGGKQTLIYATTKQPSVQQWTERKTHLGDYVPHRVSPDRTYRVSYGESINEISHESTPLSTEMEIKLGINCQIFIHLVAVTSFTNGDLTFSGEGAVNYNDGNQHSQFKNAILLECYRPDTNDILGKLGAQDYRWCYTYYNANDGTESPPSPYTAATSIGMLNGSSYIYSYALLTNIIPSTDKQVTHINVYRIGDGVTQFRLITQIENKESTLLDNFHPSQQGHSLTTIGYSAPPKVNNLTIQNGLLIGSFENRVHFSDSYVPTVWNPLNYILFDDTVTGIGSCQVGTLVFTEEKTYLVSYLGQPNVMRNLLYENLGCISGNSVASVNGYCIWQGKEGIYSYGGGGLVNVTLTSLGKLSSQIKSSCTTQDCYYGLLEDKILCINFSLNMAAYYIEAKGATSIAVVNGVLTYTTGKEVYSYDGSPAKLHWKSTWLQNVLTIIKNYKNVVVYSTGGLMYKIYVGEKEVATGTLQQGVTDIKVAQANRLGYYIVMEFEGVGEIFEIQFLTEENQNAK